MTQELYSYFLCLDTKKVSKEKSRLKIFWGDGAQEREFVAANKKKLALSGK